MVQLKYILLSLAALTAAFLISWGLNTYIRGRMTKKPPKQIHLLMILATGILLSIMIAEIYFSMYYAADEAALDVRNERNDITVTEGNGSLFVDGNGEDTAFIFYPGARVESAAYLPLMEKLAQSGIDCFALCPPRRFALLDPEGAERIMDAYSYSNIIVAGHSLGGRVASSFALNHPEQVDVLVLLAAYPAGQIDDSIGLLSIYGSEDLVLSRKEYEAAKQYYPSHSKEVVIEGGNHAGFGAYGAQRGDGEASISSDTQQTITAEAIIEFVRENCG